MARQKKEKFPYKYLQPSQLEELNRMSTEELIQEHLDVNRELTALRRQKKDDHMIADLAKQIKEHRESHEDQKEVKELQEQIKDLKKTIDLEIAQELIDKRELTKGWNDTIKASQERANVIFNIVDKRPSKRKK